MHATQVGVTVILAIVVIYLMWRTKEYAVAVWAAVAGLFLASTPVGATVINWINSAATWVNNLIMKG